MGETKRLYFLDNLRIGLTILVIAHHVGQAYGPTGGSWPIQEPARAAVLGPFFTVNRSFFMSLFFLISGYLMVMSYDRSRPWAFIKGRLLRLGVPLVLFFVLIIPLQQYLCHCWTGRLSDVSFWTYYTGYYFGAAKPLRPEMNFGHLWYVEHLLIISLCYAALRLVWRRPAGAAPMVARPLKHGAIVVFALVLAVASGVIRIWYPIDKWIGFLGFIQVAFADVPRDLSFFILGAIAYRRGWFLGLSRQTGWIWLSIGLALAVLWYAFSLGHLWPVFHISRDAMTVIYPVWEGLLCCGICIGSLVLFRERLNTQGWLGRAMAENQYAAYLFHVPVVVFLQAVAMGFAWPSFTKFALVTAVGVVLTFLLSAAIRTPVLVRRIL
jgi:peptidoglycan/LPS O-acetylase OafA/YrhL